eukprot:2468059-Rhodomonas_salina.1
MQPRTNSTLLAQTLLTMLVVHLRPKSTAKTCTRNQWPEGTRVSNVFLSPGVQVRRERKRQEEEEERRRKERRRGSITCNHWKPIQFAPGQLVLRTRWFFFYHGEHA